MKFPTYHYPSTTAEGQDERRRAAERVTAIGTSRIPLPPRSVMAQGGNSKLVVTWNAPEDDTGVSRYNIYKDTESGFYASVPFDIRRYDVAVSSGSTPSSSAVFVSSLNALGKESNKVQAIGTPTSDSTAVSDPSPPPDNDPVPPRNCVEQGVPAQYPVGSMITESVMPNSDWIAVKLPNDEPVLMDPDTLVAVWVKARDLKANDKADIGDRGEWEEIESASPIQKDSAKVYRQVTPAHTYRAGYTKKFKVHNAKYQGGIQ